MILTVTLNASIDKRYVIEGFENGRVNRVKSCEYYPGGKGLNVSKTAAILGKEVVATGFVGGHAGRFIEEKLKDYEVKSDFYHVEAESRSCINIYDEQVCKETEILEPGFYIKETEFDLFAVKMEDLAKNADVVAISGSVPLGLDHRAYQRLVRSCKEIGKSVILDTSGELLSKGIESLPTLIKPNRDEIEMLTGIKCDRFEDIVDAASELHDRGIMYVVVSLGADGALMVSDEGIFRARVPKKKAVNTVGCGDTMVAGFASSIEDGLSSEQMLRRASAMSAAAALRIETGFFVMEDYKRLMNEVVIERIDDKREAKYGKVC